MSTQSTILRWAGSKSRMMAELKKHLPAGKRLIEPFAGSCSVMMNTDYEQYLIADVNADLINMYQVIQENSEYFIEELKYFFENYNDEISYYRERNKFNLPHSGLFERALTFLYLNRHCFNGLCRYNKKGEFNTPYGKLKNPYFPEVEIRAFAEKAKRATFICASFEETLQMAKSGDVVYCDPPYLPASVSSVGSNHSQEFTAYTKDGFDYDQHSQLAGELRRLSYSGCFCVASNNDTQSVRSLYSDFDLQPLTVRRSCGGAGSSRKSADELIIKLGLEPLHIDMYGDEVWVGVDFARGTSE